MAPNKFIGILFQSRDAMHLAHLNTTSYAEHKALNEYYDGIVEKTDQFAEAYMGKYGKFTAFPSVYHQPKDPVKYLESLQKFVADARQDLPQDTELQNLIDEIADLINTTTYKLKFLK